MDLYVIRHAIAVPSTPELPDAARPLTPEGKKRFERVVRGLERLDVRFDRLYHSPWTRAVETADLLVRLCDGESVVELGLAREPTPELAARFEGPAAAVVGHEPWLSELVAILLHGDRAHGQRFELKKGAVVILEGTPKPQGMRMRALLPPRVLRRL